MKMAASKINWAQFLAEGSELPPDVTFAVMEEVHACSISRSEYHSLYILGPGCTGGE